MIKNLATGPFATLKHCLKYTDSPVFNFDFVKKFMNTYEKERKMIKIQLLEGHSF